MTKKLIRSETFRTKLLEVRKEMKLTQKQLASLVGVTSCNISHWEHGRSFPQTTQREAIYGFLYRRENERNGGITGQA